ncbi:flagellar biosynthetic protein FliO [Brevibacillus laterosporus]|uniref:flagellar biosynthetic protein FliO n=2 Tax=Brevibacillus laterosporus TaxID=1465 RepID=UPI000CE3FD24|nr:flagellar biosynthetic protein FliO [Brevibacillus laterosporus]MBG9800065.1 flagellar biosynthesis protein FliZ [Brevibacillus laterosporus]MCR8938165.1 flagellar biosynthetic protein FliO [Brevibacillus laterosporus]MCZ0840805.1 flagellar biosynthetic protein FliO [Brevibacillus laterosporus]MCZ0843646.1 flagellar biosynthetic protein FliO [Brevibacillus laterosporus]MED1909100.1 flagellar biosynthetic protein FliO [Brevibacillus laterosporus]
MNAMNIRSLFVAMLLVFAVVAPSPTVSYAEAKQTEGSAFDWLQQDAKQGKQGTGGELSTDSPVPKSPSILGYVVQIVFSLAVVVGLIYLLFKWLGKRQAGGFRESGPFRTVGGYSLGTGKSIQLVMIGDSLYVLGVGDNIQLIRQIPPGDELDVILADIENKAAPDWSWNKLGHLFQAQSKTTSTHTQQTDASFDQLLDEQWREVSHAEQQKNQWEQNRRKGD